ncbi:MAG TPA: SagB/ThcOx family dehydrogenase [Burkholderiales bacterium]|nr:SagB/ThcOx family dehydrogenase [Burkholderiales bacterium]
MAAERIRLPPPDRDGGMPLAAALQSRRSVRAFAARALSPAELGQLLWAAQGEADARDGVRTAPSAGALYPLVLFAATANGVFRYVVEEHALERVSSRDLRGDLAAAALGQQEIAEAPCVLALVAVVTRTTRKYGERGERYVHMEAGHATQNALLTATALGLAGYPVGAFEDARVAQLLRLGRSEAPLYLVPVGAPRFAAQGGR